MGFRVWGLGFRVLGFGIRLCKLRHTDSQISGLGLHSLPTLVVIVIDTHRHFSMYLPTCDFYAGIRDWVLLTLNPKTLNP